MLKLDVNRSIERCKARLVTQRYSQIEGIDYHEVFSPGARCTTSRTLFAEAIVCDIQISITVFVRLRVAALKKILLAYVGRLLEGGA